MGPGVQTALDARGSAWRDAASAAAVGSRPAAGLPSPGADTDHMDTRELQSRIDSFAVWHYRFDFGDGVSTPIFRPDYVNRHEQRKRAFFDPLVSVAGGSLRGKRVLDLGCNAGYWSLAAIEAGADFVFGIDGRQVHVDQANLVFEAKGVEESRYRFELGNIFSYDFTGRFDVVLCLGLMYHIAKPIELFELMSGVEPQLLLIDTAVSLAPASVLQVEREDTLENVRNAVDYEIVFIPSRQAVLDMAGQFGFTGVPLAHAIGDYTGMRDYQTMQRAAFICSRGVSLEGVRGERMDARTLLWAAARKRAKRHLRVVPKLARGRRAGGAARQAHQ
jgi:tRNA (mo5U34)-methyltransferase